MSSNTNLYVEADGHLIGFAYSCLANLRESTSSIKPISSELDRALCEKPVGTSCSVLALIVALCCSAMSATEEPVAVEPSPVPAAAGADDAPYVEPGETAPDADSAPAPEEAPAPAPPAKPASSPEKKIARPAKPRSSMPGKGKKTDGEPKSFQPGDIVLSRLKGYPPWRESFYRFLLDRTAELGNFAYHAFDVAPSRDT